MQMVSYLLRDEALRGEAANREGYAAGRPAYEETTKPPGTVPRQMDVIGLVAQPVPGGGVLMIRTILTNALPTGG